MKSNPPYFFDHFRPQKKNITMSVSDKDSKTSSLEIPAETPEVAPEPAWKIPAVLLLNASSSIGIVGANKIVFKFCDFKYGTLLTFIHFVFTFIGLEVCRRCGIFEKKELKVAQVLPLCLSFCGFVCLTNLSLVYNSVGFYQLIKVLTAPLLVIIQSFFYGQTFSTKIKVSLAVTCTGVALATGSDTEANAFGTFVALSALLITAQYQIWVGTKQKELECSSWQLLWWQAPISAVMLIPAIPFFDPIAQLTQIPDKTTIAAIFLSSCLAFLVNLSIFLVIGKTSPVTYNVLGHVKLVTILIMGFVIFGEEANAKNIGGIVLTLAGCFAYTHFKTNEAKK